MFSLLAGVIYLQIDNAQLAAAIAKQNSQLIDVPDTTPVVVDPVPVATVSPIQAIKDKLAADGCNLNADL